VVVGGRTLLDRALAATADARRVVVVGPAPQLSERGEGMDGPRSDTSRERLVAAREDPPFGGPVAGIAAGLRALGPEPSAWVLVLACDVPRAADAVPLLVRALATLSPELSERGPGTAAPRSDNPGGHGEDGAFLVRGGRAQWLVGIYRRDRLDSALDALRDAAGSVHGAPVRRLVAQLRCLEVEDPDGLSDDVDTWDDAERLDRALTDETRRSS
jgi:molybdopterin-guanine dinucleotide biosynthesis protein A